MYYLLDILSDVPRGSYLEPVMYVIYSDGLVKIIKN